MQLDTTTRKLQAVLTAAMTTANMNVTVDYVDITTSALPVAGLTPTNTNGTTPVDILAAPAASTVRKVNSITIYNADSAAKTVSVNLDDNGTDYLIVKSTLQVGETLGYTDTRGWYSLDANGNTKVSPLTSMTSAQLAALLSDETGTAGSAVFSVSPTLTTPKAETTLGVGNATPSASGAGITFPATQSASTDANTLDDYEEGTWTPVLSFTTPGDLSVTYSGQVGTYTKIGDMVTAHFSVGTSAFTHTTASGSLELQGFPFASGSEMDWYGSATWRGITKAGYTDLLARLNTTATIANCVMSASGSAPSAVSFSDVPTGGVVALRGFISFRV